MIEVTLSPDELMFAALVGIRRQVHNLFAGRQDKHGAPRDKGWQIHVEGAAGERAVAKAKGAYWDGNLGDLGADDVGRVQVRTRSNHDFDLIIHKDDPDDRAFILVTGIAPTYSLRGWIYGRDAKQQEWWQDPAGGRPAYFVPQSALRPIVKKLEPAP